MKKLQLLDAQQNLEKGYQYVDRWLGIWGKEVKKARKEEDWKEWGNRMENALQKVRSRRERVRSPSEDLKGALEDYINVKLVMEEVVDLAREVLGEERQIS